MVGVTFRKAIAEYFIHCLDKQQPIEPPGDKWTADNMLALAGACFCVVTSQGPRWLKAQGVDISQLGEEQKEAVEESVVPELHAAVEWIADRCFDIVDGAYDEAFEADHRAMITVDGDERKVVPVEGFKTLDG